MTRSKRGTKVERLALRLGMAAGPSFLIVAQVQGAVRPDYLPRRHPISSLALGPAGWVQNVNFVLAGASYLASAATLYGRADSAPAARTGPALIVASAAGIVAAAAFPTDPVSGYPPGSPDSPLEPTRAGQLHDLVSIPTFVGLPLAAAVHSWRFARTGEPRWATYSGVTSGAMVVSLVCSIAGFGQAPRFVDNAGTWQRGCLAAGFTWLTALMCRDVGA